MTLTSFFSKSSSLRIQIHPFFPPLREYGEISLCLFCEARKLNFELAPFFQLNSKGYRKNWANTAIAEYKPFSRWNKNNMRFFEDYMLRFQLQRVRMTGRPRFAVFKAYMFVGLLTGFADMMWCHEYLSFLFFTTVLHFWTL